MAAPTYQPGTAGNIVPEGTSLAAGKAVAALMDFSTILQASVQAKLTTGATAPTNPTTFNFHKVANATAAGNTLLTANIAAATTSVPVASSAGIAIGEKVALISAATGRGELVTVDSTTSTTLTLGAGTVNAYSTNDKVFRIDQTPGAASIGLGPGVAINTTTSLSRRPDSAWVWILNVTNTDNAQTVTVAASYDTNPTFQ